MAGTVVIIGTFDVAGAARDRAEALFAMMNEETRKEAGCLYYAFSADFADRDRFHLAEIWVDEAALAGHLQTEHMSVFVKTMPELDCKRDVTKWEGTALPLG
jgi:quinol monooxygenase YgiN